MAAPLIHVQDLYKSYQRDSLEIPVLRDINLEIAEGEFIAFMGPSGSGKTTLLNLIAGIDKPTSGKILIAGIDVTELNETELAVWRSRNVGFIFQFYNLIPVLTALENVELPLILTPLAKKARRAHAEMALARRRPGGAHASLSAPTLRRPGTAGGDRPRHRHRSGDPGGR